MFVLEEEHGELFRQIERRNLMRQYQLMGDCIRIGLAKGGSVSFDKYMLWVLNHIAVANISQFGGRFRKKPVYVGDHIPPHYNDVDGWVDHFITTIQENWYYWNETQLAAYGLWRLNWIHPFIDGNGRTARAASYFLLCARLGFMLPGKKIIPERIQESREEYNKALSAADRAWDNGHLDFTQMTKYIGDLLEAQIQDT